MEHRLRVETTKWPDSPHWEFDVRLLGDDGFGTWVHAPATTTIRRGTEPPFSLGTPLVGLIPPDEWWLVEFYPDHPTLAVYVNIGTPPVRDGSRVTQVDLDLDVVRRLDGTVEIIDEDEFAEHQVTLAYPESLIENARTAADRAARLMREGTEPFRSAADEWLKLVEE